ncbi:hypothetical protein A1Q1_04845 [Trichosporon asahii var. asahii CBS 2479]|uniref:Uncharacterized protein n=1 Tax=Trichosporon asahii var. asahii (strain ATCC 90039 / CBS 2479 / JCM 2466 / KCTC 7840 / NBRC 103889/ NCYC 2677 / UAMH 7654) TaxID=1186058 RepID=J4U829_TRIAS|nr:hypothetical protein A1Q1_04845 [Trichosporon asahii var. asahii CBS 2479]EJT46550.1 hypothetical protein A1Q1_04845 [Trichosporon asahii var. asahii CBS 2479]
MVPPCLSFPTLTFSGIGAPTVEDFIAALEGQLSASDAPLLPGQISGRLTSRALLWYTETICGHHFRLTDDGYRDLRSRLLAEFSLRERNPQRIFRTLTQGYLSVEEYATEWRTLAGHLGEDVESYLNRTWWAYGLRSELRDIALAAMHISTFGELAGEVHRAERLLCPRTSQQCREVQQACSCSQGESDWDEDSTWEMETTGSTEETKVAEDIQRTNGDTAGLGGSTDAELVKLFGELLRARLLSP